MPTPTPTPTPTRVERLEGGLIGLLVGDALGVPYEFRAPERIPAPELIDYDPPPGFDRAHKGTPPATWSDDGAQALCLLDSLLVCDRFDAEDFARRLLRWADEGYLAVDGRVFDIGITTSTALANIRAGVPALGAGPTAEHALGNGSLMRALPLALWNHGTDAELAADAAAQSRVTHGHPRAQVCGALYCLWARRILDETADPWGETVAALRTLYPEGTAERAELELNIRPDDAPHGLGRGYVVDSLRSARLVQRAGAGDYAAVVRAAVALGHDTDTTACIAGGIAGLREGVAAIPARWREGLRGRELVAPLLAGLLARG